MRVVVIGWVAVMLCGLGIAQSSQTSNAGRLNLKEDVRLQVKVSFRAKYLSLQEFTQRLSAQTGVPISVSSEYADEKLTLFVKERPAYEVMERAVEVLGLAWGEGLTQGSYRIVRSRQRIEEEAEYERRMARNRQRLAEKLRELIEESRSSLTEWLEGQKRARTDVAYDDSSEPQMDVAYDDSSEPEHERDLSSAIARGGIDLSMYILGRWLSTWSETEWQRFWEGKVIKGTYPATKDSLPLPSELPVWYQQILQPRGVSLSSDKVTIINSISIHYDSLRNDAQYCFYADVSLASPEEGYIESSLTANQGIYVEPEPYFSSPESELPDILANIPLREPKAPLPCNPNRWDCLLADQLEWLSQHCDVPIVGQAFRVRSWNTLDTEAKNLLECVSRLQMSHDLEYREGYLLVRYSADEACKHRRTEIPERVISEMERRATLKEMLDLDDYAWFVSQLSEAQASNLREGAGFITPNQLAFETAPIAEALPALRFWASLTETQKRQVLSGKALPYNRLSPEQRNLFLRALEENTRCSHMFSLTFDDSSEQEPQDMSPSFSLKVGEGTLYVDGDPVIPTAAVRIFVRQGADYQSSKTMQAFRAKRVEFLFGIGDGETVRYRTTLRATQPKKESNRK